MFEIISLNYDYGLEIDINPGVVASWAAIKKGFNNLSESLNEVVYQAAYIGSHGWKSSEVTGGQLTLTLAGVRYYGDAAQDWLFSDGIKYKFGNYRKTTIRITRQNSAILTWPVTIVNVNESGGAADQPNVINVVIHGNGAPTISTDVYLPALTVVSIAGSVASDTLVAVNPILSSGSNSYKYQLSAAPINVEKDQVLTTGWTAWNGTDEITATTGQYITVVEIVTVTNAAVKAGSALVTTA